jgi:cystathionine gamma-synthase
MTPDMKPATIAAQALGTIDDVTRAIVPPIHVTTTYLRDVDNQYRTGNVYGRPDNETIRHVERVVTALEGGEDTLLLGSGMAAAVTVFQALAPGDHVIAPKVMYWALRNWLANEATRWGLAVDFVAMDDLDAVRAAIRPGKTKLVWAETPANPLWTLTDLAEVAGMAHAVGAILAVDSTAATPILSRPLALGADIVMHAATKYLNGHSDVLAGTLTCRDKAHPLWARMGFVRKMGGAILGPFEAYLLLRGLRTLPLRVEAQSRAAMVLAERFAAHPHVAEVLYPGLPGFAGHALARRQMPGGFGGMMSIRVKGGATTAIGTAARVGLWKRATSLGGVESLIEHRASIEGPGTPCPDDLLRLSVGIEDAGDLHDDLDRALRAANG